VFAPRRGIQARTAVKREARVAVAAGDSSSSRSRPTSPRYDPTRIGDPAAISTTRSVVRSARVASARSRRRRRQAREPTRRLDRIRSTRARPRALHDIPRNRSVDAAGPRAGGTGTVRHLARKIGRARPCTLKLLGADWQAGTSRRRAFGASAFIGNSLRFIPRTRRGCGVRARIRRRAAETRFARGRGGRSIRRVA